MRDPHCLLAMALAVLAACSHRAVPAQSSSDKRDCDDRVALMAPDSLIRIPHHEVGQRAVTCNVGLVRDCENQLKAWACELGADVVIVDTTPIYGNPSQRLVGRDGRAIRYDRE